MLCGGKISMYHHNEDNSITQNIIIFLNDVNSSLTFGQTGLQVSYFQSYIMSTLAISSDVFGQTYW